MSDKYLMIPVDWFKKDMTYQEMIILAEIVSFCKNSKACFAQNTHFAELLDIKKHSVSRTINSLISKGFITSKIKKGSRNNVRNITVNKMLLTHSQNVINQSQNVKRPISTKSTTSIVPTRQQVSDYVDDRKSSVNPQVFYDYYSADDWKGIKNWKQKLLTWERYNKDENKNKEVNPKW